MCQPDISLLIFCNSTKSITNSSVTTEEVEVEGKHLEMLMTLTTPLKISQGQYIIYNKL